MSSPFAYGGPGFLLFYVVFAAIVIAVYAWIIFARRETPPPRLNDLTADPYSIAYLRGGAPETVAVAVVNLVDRGLLRAEVDEVRAAKDAGSDFVRRPLDRAIIGACTSLRDPHLLHQEPAVAAACEDYERMLAERGLLPDTLAQKLRRTGLFVVIGMLAGLSVLRIGQALARGQVNLVFLVLLTAMACFIVWRVSRRRMTAAGKEALATLRTLTQRLQRQAAQLRAGGATNEALLLAAVYGVHALPAAFDEPKRLFRQRRKSDGTCSSSCGSSSSCSSRGSSSSCGGGGGGGGGGCGGCGGGGD